MTRDEYDELKAENNNFKNEADRECLENELIAVGLFGLQDPLREGIVESISNCREAGISVIMCTGDNLDTAKAISIKANIIDESINKQVEGSDAAKYTCLTGEQFRNLVCETDGENAGKIVR